MLNIGFFIKAFHSLIFFFMSGCLIYIFYAGITRTFNMILLIAIIAILTEGLVLIFNKWRCPLTSFAEKYGAEKGTVTDMFLPDVISRNAFKIAIVLFPVELILLGIRYFIW
jgi:hypothetical protein